MKITEKYEIVPYDNKRISEMIHGSFISLACIINKISYVTGSCVRVKTFLFTISELIKEPETSKCGRLFKVLKFKMTVNRNLIGQFNRSPHSRLHHESWRSYVKNQKKKKIVVLFTLI